MSGKRRDKKGRILHPGEYQDESGRYSYKYKDFIGRRRTLYSWCLIPTDRTPEGKRKKKCLRDQIKELEKELSRGVWHDNMNVCELVERYLMTKTGVRHSTLSGYKTVQRTLASEPFGQVPIHKVKLSDAKLFLIKRKEKGKVIAPFIPFVEYYVQHFKWQLTMR